MTMKKSILSSLLLCTGLLMASSFSVTPSAVHARATTELTAAQRKFAVDYYNESKARLLKDLKGLSAAQLNWKADPSRWSIAECTEHIALSESYILGWIQMTLKQAAAPEKKSEVKMTTDQLIAATIDRSHKAQAPEPLKPSGRFPTTQDAINNFVGRRDSTISYIQTTQDDLTNHYMAHPVFGTLDAYQGLIFLAAHSVRHTEQIEEVMAAPGFPKN
jgi:DinB superfamily